MVAGLAHSVARGGRLPPLGIIGGPSGKELSRPIFEGISERAEVLALYAAAGPVGCGTHCSLCEFIDDK